MSASDLPEAHASATAMARCLASYIDDPERIRREVSAAFGASPCVYTIREMRRIIEKNRARKVEVFHPHEGYYPSEASERAAEASKTFLWRLDQERLRSQREREAA